MGEGRVAAIDRTSLEMHVRLDREPPPPLPLRLVLALPRPKVIHRIIVDAVTLGIKEIDIVNAWRVDKSYWESPLIRESHLLSQARLGLEQGQDTILPAIRLHRFFSTFVNRELPAQLGGRAALLADPGGDPLTRRSIDGPVVLAIGPEGGFIDREIRSFHEAGFKVVSLDRRTLRVETALAAAVGKLF
jgi:RsmE family RNA methyltransferase